MAKNKVTSGVTYKVIRGVHRLKLIWIKGASTAERIEWNFYAKKKVYLDQNELKALVQQHLYDKLYVLPGEHAHLEVTSDRVDLLEICNYDNVIKYAEIYATTKETRKYSNCYPLCKRSAARTAVLHLRRLYEIGWEIRGCRVKINDFQKIILR